MGLWICPKCRVLYGPDMYTCPKCHVSLNFATLGGHQEVTTVVTTTTQVRETFALRKILTLAEALANEPVQSRSIERRYSTLIKAAALEGLGE